MSSNEIADLANRVALLERDVGAMKSVLWPAAAPPAPQAWAPPAPPRLKRAQRRPLGAGLAGPPWAPPATEPALAPPDEAKLAGTWFARGGALAVLLGAGFAFKYGIDRGVINEPVRILIGLLVGLGFIAWGNWARRKGWDRFAQAVTAGGVAICYLSVLVADLAYHLISGPVTIGALASITVGSAALAWFYDSLALALLATVGGLLNPVLAAPGGRPDPLPLYSYLAILDLGVLVMAYFKNWQPLDAVARAGTWVLFAVGLEASSFTLAESFASTFLIIFTAVPFVRSLTRRTEANEADAALLGLNALVYFGFSMKLLAHFHPGVEGQFTFGLATAFAGLGWLAHVLLPGDKALRRYLWAIGVIAGTLAVPLQFSRFDVASIWAAEGLALTWLGMRARSVPARNAGALILGLGTAVTAALLLDSYHPAHPLISTQSAHLAAQIVILAIEAYLFSRDADPVSPRVWYPLAAVAANALALVWMSAEAGAYLHPVVGGPGWQPLLFTLSAIWGLYATILLTVGIAARLRWARLAALVLFAVTVTKMVLLDLWTLSSGERVLAFIGLGAVLLACSLMYHNFKDVMRYAEPRIP